MGYDLEMYAKALETMADDPVMINFPQDSLVSMRDFYDHAIADWHRRRGLRQAAEMLRKTKMSLYVVYPGHFPEPQEEPTDEPR